MKASLVLPTLLEQHAVDYPERLFLTDATTGTQSTYRQFVDDFHRWAGALRTAEVRAGDSVLVMMPTCNSALAAWLGIARLRAVEVPVNTQYHGQMLSYIIDDSEASVMVLHVDYLDQVTSILGSASRLRTLVVVDAEDSDLPTHSEVEIVAASQFLSVAEDISEEPRPEGHDIAAIVYTSGTTGASKGVIMPWAQVHATALHALPMDQLSAEDIAYLPFPFHHVVLKAPVYAIALLTGQVVVRDKFSLSNYWKDIDRHSATYTFLLSVMLNMVMNSEPQAADKDNTLRLVGVVPRPSNIREFEDRFGVQSGTFFNMTETSVPFVDHGALPRDPSSCGHVRPGIEVRLVDENDYPVSIGKVGELIVRAEAPWKLNAGYWKKPEATARAWRNGWFHTGDAFREDDDGNYYFVDRFKDAIRRRGENVSSIEIEAFVQENPAVDEVAAIGVPSPLGEQEIKVVVVRKPRYVLTEEDLIEDLNARMPKFMVPRFIQFVDDLPKTPTYKIMKGGLSREVGSDGSWDRESTN